MEQILNKKRIALYARVSTIGLGQDPMLQITHLRAFATNRDFEVVGEFVDRISGTKFKRPALNDLMKQARVGKFKVVAFTALDRIGRSVVEVISLLNELTELGISVISLRENLDCTSSHGRALIGMLAVINALEKDIVSCRVREGIQARKMMAEKLGDTSFRLGRPLTLTDEMIEKINALRLKGVSIRKIATELSISKTSVLRIVGTKTAEKYKSQTPRK